MREKLINLASRLILKMLRRWASLSDQAQARILGVLDWVFTRVKGLAAAVGPVRELRELAEKDAAGTRLLKNLILEARDEQVLSLIRGILRHHAGKDPIYAGVSPAGPMRKPRHSLLQLGLAGDHFDVERMREACRENPGCQGVPVRAGELLAGEDFATRLNCLEIADPDLATGEFVSRALRRRVAVSLHHSLVSSAEMLNKCLAESRLAGTPFRVFTPILYYPPLQRVKRLLDEGLIGEVGSVRIRATMGGKGGTLQPQTVSSERWLDHPAFDHFLLLAFLGGRIEKVTAYLNPMDPEKGGQGLVDCKFSHPGRYGLLECTLAPDLQVRSEHYPYDLEVEVAGSDGIIWLNRGMAERTQEAPIRVRVGKSAYSIGVESGLEVEWAAVYRNAAADLLRMVAGKGGYRMRDEEMLSAVVLRNRVYEAAASREVVCL